MSQTTDIPGSSWAIGIPDVDQHAELHPGFVPVFLFLGRKRDVLDRPFIRSPEYRRSLGDRSCPTFIFFDLEFGRIRIDVEMSERPTPILTMPMPFPLVLAASTYSPSILRT